MQRDAQRVFPHYQQQDMCRGEKEWGSVWSKCYLEIIFIYILFKNAVFLHLKKSTFYLWSSIDCSQKVFVNNRRSWDVKKLQKALANVWTFHGCFLKKEIIKIITTNKMFLIFYFILLFVCFRGIMVVLSYVKMERSRS